jgi:hypothetical protein
MGLQQVPAIAPVISVGGTAGRTTSSGGTTPVLDLATSGVSATTYGSASLIPSLTVDAYGRVTSATTNALSAGGMTLLASGSLNGVTTLSLSSINQGYKTLVLRAMGMTTATGTGESVTINGLSSGYNYLYTTVATTPALQFQNTQTLWGSCTRTYTTENQAFSEMIFPNYSMTGFKYIVVPAGAGGASAEFRNYVGICTSSTAAITSMTFGGTIMTGGTYEMYGVK